MTIPTLTTAEVRKLSRELRAAGLELPAIGWTIALPPAARDAFRDPDSRRAPGRVVHDATGYYFTSWDW